MTIDLLQKLPQAILFDLDGTLADTAPDLIGAIHKLQVSHGKIPTPYKELRPFASAGARGLICAALGVKPEDDVFEALKAEFLANYEADIAKKSSLFKGIVEMLQELEVREIKWGIVTNKAAKLTDLLIPQIGLKHAGCVISGDTTAHAKPHPAPVLEAASRLSLTASQCWYVGDDLRDIQAGQAAGMPTIAAAWGYCGTSAPQAWDATVVLESPMGIIDQLNVCLST